MEGLRIREKQIVHRTKCRRLGKAGKGGMTAMTIGGIRSSKVMIHNNAGAQSGAL
jgi:hypothetical protein